MALRAIDLMGEYLHIAREARQMVLRISPDNVASMKLAERSGFTPLGVFEEPEGPMARFIRDLRQP
jgi:RimJ/RimL family protein N-acetyltransferase